MHRDRSNHLTHGSVLSFPVQPGCGGRTVCLLICLLPEAVYLPTHKCRALPLTAELGNEFFEPMPPNTYHQQNNKAPFLPAAGMLKREQTNTSVPPWWIPSSAVSVANSFQLNCPVILWMDRKNPG